MLDHTNGDSFEDSTKHSCAPKDLSRALIQMMMAKQTKGIAKGLDEELTLKTARETEGLVHLAT